MNGDFDGVTIPLRGVLAKWDAMTFRWGLDGDERSALLGGIHSGAVSDVSSYGLPAAERRMRLLLALEPILNRVFDDEEQLREWLRLPNRHFCHRTPLETMAQSPEWVRWLINALGIVS